MSTISPAAFSAARSLVYSRAQHGSRHNRRRRPQRQPRCQFCCGRTARPGPWEILRSTSQSSHRTLPAQNPTHTAIVVCPGGGYSELAIDKEGTQVAHWLNDRGVAAFVLTYRYGPRYHYPIPLLDAQRAIRYVRTHASEDSIDPDRIGIMGFSAGGHLASTAGTHFDNGNPDTTDPIEHASSRPDFMVLAYPVISMEPGITHNGSLHHLLGEEPNPMLENELSNETQVTPQTPPTFLFSTTNDETVPVMNSVLFYEALLRSGVPAELHIFEQGHHGSGLAQDNPQLRMWPILLQNWLHLHGWMAIGSRIGRGV